MCESNPPAEVTVVTEPSASRHARRFLDEHWCVEHAALLRPQAELVVTELVTNAVQHGTPPVRVLLDCGGPEVVTISVSDANPAVPHLVDAGPDALVGRGIRLVQVLSDEWGVRTRPGGKTVWSRFLL